MLVRPYFLLKKVNLIGENIGFSCETNSPTFDFVVSNTVKHHPYISAIFQCNNAVLFHAHINHPVLAILRISLLTEPSYMSVLL